MNLMKTLFGLKQMKLPTIAALEEPASKGWQTVTSPLNKSTWGDFNEYCFVPFETDTFTLD